MNSLQFDFNVDKNTNTVLISREFAAELPLVWDAFTKQEILDKWWAPKPWKSITKAMEFKVGGKRFYAMVSPEGAEPWSLQKFTAINPKSNFKMTNAFADKNENPELPASDWDFSFTQENSTNDRSVTKVVIAITNESRERFEKMIEMGFQGGFTMTLNYLDTLLQNLKR